MLFDSNPHRQTGARGGRPDLSLDLVIHGGGVALVPRDTAANAPRSPAGEDFFKRRWIEKHHSENGR
jgi:hypothetical protein